MSDQQYSIHEASKLTGLPASTLRYYESVGIIQPIRRGETSGHRAYSQRDLDILDTIACLNATGMRLDDMKSYIGNLPEGFNRADDQVRLLESQYERLVEEERHIHLRKEYIRLKVKYWKHAKNHDTPTMKTIGMQAKQLAEDLKRI